MTQDKETSKYTKGFFFKGDQQAICPLEIMYKHLHFSFILCPGADINRQDNDGLSALSWACTRGRVQAVQCLLDRGAEINQADLSGKIPLDLAASQGNPSAVQVIISLVTL